MKQDAHNYLNGELDYFQKEAELQFNHFMQVFYFWTLIVITPITAGLLANQGTSESRFILGILLVSISIIGLFLAAKMFDIRCSQLRYLIIINTIRGAIYEGVKTYLPDSYHHYFPPETNLRKTARKDFGRSMAIVMSLVHGVYLGLGLPLLLSQITLCSFSSVLYFFISAGYFIFGIYIYYNFISRIPKPFRIINNKRKRS